MMEYTRNEIVELIEELPVIKVDAGLVADAAETHAVVDAYEGALELIEGILAKARYGALAQAGIALPADGALYLPVANNCSLSAGVSLAADGRAAFAVKAFSSGALVEHFAARDAVRHAATGNGPAPTAIPDPAENGADATLKAARTRTVAAPDAAGRPFKDVVPEEDEGDADGAGATPVGVDPKVDVDVDRDDVAKEGLSQPASGLSYLGVGSQALARLSEVPDHPARTDGREIRADWRVRVSCLVITDPAVRGHLPADASRLAADPDGPSTPGAFVAALEGARLARAERRVRGEDLVGLSLVEKVGAEAAREQPEGRAARLADARLANLRAVAGEVMLVPAGTPTDDPRVVAAAGRALEGRFADAFLSRLTAREHRREATRLIDAHNLWARGRERRRRTGSAVASLLEAGLDVDPASFRSSTFLAELGKAAKGLAGEGLLEDLRGAYRAARKTEDRCAARPLHPGSGPFNDPMSNRGDVAKLYRAGLRGKASRLAESGAPEHEVRFWRTFELKENGDPKGAYAAPVVPFGGTPVAPHELGWVNETDARKARLRDHLPAGLLASRVTERPPVAVRYCPDGNAVRVRAVRWTERSEVLYDPEGLFAPSERPAVRTGRRHQALLSAVADGMSAGAVLSPAEFEALNNRLKEQRGPAPASEEADYADRLPEAERESGPDLGSGSSARGRDPFVAERQQGQEAVIATRSGRAIAPSRTEAQRLRAKSRLDATVAEARDAARTNAPANGDLKALRDRALAAHMAALPVAERLELFLALHGPKEIPELTARASDPTGLVLAARELYRAGRVTFKGDSLRAPALTAEAKRELNRTLLAAVNAPANAPAAADVA